MDLFNEKLDQLERLEGFLAKIEAKGKEFYKPTIEATKRKIDDLITMIPSYVNAENEENEHNEARIILLTRKHLPDKNLSTMKN
jgi:hypothetical protein